MFGVLRVKATFYVYTIIIQTDRQGSFNAYNYSDRQTGSWPRWLSWMRRPTEDQEVAGSTPAEVGNIIFVEIDHEIFSTVILSLPLIQEGQLSVSGKRM